MYFNQDEYNIIIQYEGSKMRKPNATTIQATDQLLTYKDKKFDEQILFVFYFELVRLTSFYISCKYI